MEEELLQRKCIQIDSVSDSIHLIGKRGYSVARQATRSHEKAQGENMQNRAVLPQTPRLHTLTRCTFPLLVRLSIEIARLYGAEEERWEYALNHATTGTLYIHTMGDNSCHGDLLVE